MEQEKQQQKKDQKKLPKAGPRQTGAPVRLWVRAVFTGYRRNKDSQHTPQALLKIQHLQDRSQAFFYNGKRVAYIYKVQNKIQGKKYRVIWGRLCRPHGNNGTMIAKFAKNLPPRAIGGQLRVMLYPHRFSFNMNDWCGAQ